MNNVNARPMRIPQCSCAGNPARKSPRFIEKYYPPSRYTFGVEKKNTADQNLDPGFCGGKALRLFLRIGLSFSFQVCLVSFFFFFLDKFHLIKLQPSSLTSLGICQAPLVSFVGAKNLALLSGPVWTFCFSSNGGTMLHI